MNINWKYNIGLLFIAVLITILPFMIVKNSDFAGADTQAKNTTQEISKDFEPWFSPFWEPPGTETESMLFALQAAIGSGIIFYCIGYLKGKNDANKK